MHLDGLKAPTSPTIPEVAKITPVQIPHPITALIIWKMPWAAKMFII